MPLSWQAGETISALVYAMTGGATTARMELDGNIVATAAVPGTISYEFSADVDARYYFRLDTGSATWELSCTPPRPAPPLAASPVPAMTTYGLALTVLGLLLLAARRLSSASRRR